MEVIQALITPFLQLLGIIGVALIGVWGAKRYNIGPNQDKLVTTLNNIIAAQDERIAQLEQKQKEQEKENEKMRNDLEDLKSVTVSQAKLVDIQSKTIHELETQIQSLGQTPRTRRSIIQ